ncbi:MAG TPA: TetR family transcriptional regulator [Rhizomicrobium sp.]
MKERAATRNVILAAARRVAERDGVLEMSLTGVAQEAALAPTSVYGFFTSKNDLLLSVIADDLATLARAMRGAFGCNEDVVEENAVAGGDALTPMPATFIAAPQGEVPANDSLSTAEVKLQAPKVVTPAEPSVGAADVIARLQETVARLETRPVDAWLERRLREFERALAALEGRHVARNSSEATVEERLREFDQSLDALEQRLRAATEDAAHGIGQRLETCEKRLREFVSDGQADAAALARRLIVLENAAYAAKPEFFEAQSNPPYEQTHIPEKAPAAAVADVASAEPIAPAAGETAASYLAAARRSAQAAAMVRDHHGRKVSRRKSETMIYLAMGSLFLLVAVLTAAGLLLRNEAITRASASDAPKTADRVESAPAPRSARLDPQSRLRELAAAADPEAGLLLGLEYLDGSGAPKNDSMAFEWFSRAAARNQPLAQYQLGLMYEDGRGVRPDAAQAFHWFESAALKGNRHAMHSLATAYAEGRGTATNLTEAARWFARAAELGAVNDQFNLGVLYERGMGVPESLPDAYRWYAIAAAQGDQESQARVAALAPTLAPEDLAAARSAADSFKPDPLAPAANFAPKLIRAQ